MTSTGQSSLIRRLRDARKARDLHERRFQAEVRKAMRNRDGYTVAQIAAAAGLSRERLYQIAAGRR